MQRAATHVVQRAMASASACASFAMSSSFLHSWACRTTALQVPYRCVLIVAYSCAHIGISEPLSDTGALILDEIERVLILAYPSLCDERTLVSLSLSYWHMQASATSTLMLTSVSLSVSSYYYVCVLILLYVSLRTTVCVSSSSRNYV